MSKNLFHDVNDYKDTILLGFGIVGKKNHNVTAERKKINMIRTQGKRSASIASSVLCRFLRKGQSATKESLNMNSRLVSSQLQFSTISETIPRKGNFGQKRSFSTRQECVIELSEQLKHLTLSQLATETNSVRESNSSNSSVSNGSNKPLNSPPKKSLIQARGIEGANNKQRLQNNTDGNIDTVQEKASLWVAPSFESDLIVVLDMDECLIHAQFFGNKDIQSSWSSSSSSSSDIYRQYEADRPYLSPISADDDEDTICCESFCISLPDGDHVQVNKRPHLSSFLEEVCNNFETYIFTAAVPIYASPVLDELDPKRNMIQGRLYRDSCSLDAELGVYVKDLNTVLDHRHAYLDQQQKQQDQHKNLQEIARGNEERIVLVDNNPFSFLANPSNGILVNNFYDDPTDQTLPAVLELLHELGQEKYDVRPHLHHLFGLKDVLKDVIKKR